MKLPWFGSTREEIEEVVRELIARHGGNAYDEAIHISDVWRSLGGSRNEKLYRLAARHIELTTKNVEDQTRSSRNVLDANTGSDEPGPSRV